MKVDARCFYLSVDLLKSKGVIEIRNTSRGVDERGAMLLGQAELSLVLSTQRATSSLNFEVIHRVLL